MQDQIYNPSKIVTLLEPPLKIPGSATEQCIHLMHIHAIQVLSLQAKLTQCGYFKGRQTQIMSIVHNGRVDRLAPTNN